MPDKKMNDDLDLPILLCNHKGKYLAWAASSFAILVVLLILIFVGDRRWQILYVTFAVGVACMCFTWAIFDRRPRIKIDATGLNDIASGRGLVEWDEIAGARLLVINDATFLMLRVRSPGKYRSRIKLLHRILYESQDNDTEIGVNVSRVSLSPEAIETIVTHQLYADTGAG